jgi:VanZ family protein
MAASFKKIASSTIILSPRFFPKRSYTGSYLPSLSVMIYFAIIFYLSLFPFKAFQWHYAPLEFLWLPLPTYQLITDNILNICLYWPYGVLLMWVYAEEKTTLHSIVSAMVIASITALLAELSQQFSSIRISSNLDIIYNMIGGLIGCLTYFTLDKIGLLSLIKRWRIHYAQTDAHYDYYFLLIVLWFLAQTSPSLYAFSALLWPFEPDGVFKIMLPNMPLPLSMLLLSECYAFCNILAITLLWICIVKPLSASYLAVLLSTFLVLILLLKYQLSLWVGSPAIMMQSRHIEFFTSTLIALAIGLVANALLTRRQCFIFLCIMAVINIYLSWQWPFQPSFAHIQANLQLGTEQLTIILFLLEWLAFLWPLIASITLACVYVSNLMDRLRQTTAAVLP